MGQAPGLRSTLGPAVGRGQRLSHPNLAAVHTHLSPVQFLMGEKDCSAIARKCEPWPGTEALALLRSRRLSLAQGGRPRSGSQNKEMQGGVWGMCSGRGADCGRRAVVGASRHPGPGESAAAHLHELHCRRYRYRSPPSVPLLCVLRQELHVQAAAFPSSPLVDAASPAACMCVYSWQKHLLIRRRWPKDLASTAVSVFKPDNRHKAKMPVTSCD